ncbi:MAG: HEAT repeat domain-containing protein [Candidatus Hodarchaeales archaeon]|jgi:hypothetical protein
MTLNHSDIQEQISGEIPSFSTDITRAITQLALALLSWYVFLSIIWPFLRYLLGFLGDLAAGILMIMLLLYTFTIGGLFLDALAYQSAVRNTGLPYMNYTTKCPYFFRKRLTFYCRAEQIADFDVPAFRKCHNEDMWLQCWPERVPSILNIFDTVPLKRQQQLAYLLASMKEYASSASFKMMEVLTNEQVELLLRMSAGYALSEMKEESALEPLINLLDRELPAREEQTIRAIITRFGVLALAPISTALENSESDIKAGGFVEIIGRIADPSGIPILKETLFSPQTQEYTRLQTVYGLQAIGTKEAYSILIEYLENAPEDEKSILKDVLLSEKAISLPNLINLLSREDISDEYYAEIGDVLAQVQAPTYDHFFSKLLEKEEESKESAKYLAKTLKEHTPEEEEYIALHTVLDKYI